jgi:hypothetical protein
VTPRRGDRQITNARIGWSVILKHHKGQMDGVITTVTPNGAFIRCLRPLRLNDVCWMRINAPSRSFEAKGLVVWSNIYGPDDEITPRGMRVRFLRIKSKDRMFIADVLEDQTLEKEADDYLRTLNFKAEKITLDKS